MRGRGVAYNIPDGKLALARPGKPGREEFLLVAEKDDLEGLVALVTFTLLPITENVSFYN